MQKIKHKRLQRRARTILLTKVHRLVTEQKEKVRQDYERKAKNIETDYAIQKSSARDGRYLVSAAASGLGVIAIL